MAKGIKEIFTSPNCILKIIILVVSGVQIGFAMYVLTSVDPISFYYLLNLGVITIIIALLIAFIFFESTPCTETCLLAGCIILIGEIIYKYLLSDREMPATLVTELDQYTIVILLCLVEAVLVLLDVIFLQKKNKS